jgi:hypothetical protein
MGHADIATTMIYVHHVPQHDAADRLTELVRTRTDVGCEAGATESETEREAEPGIPSLAGDSECRRQDSNLRHADYDSAALTS